MCNIAAANARQIDHAQPEPIDGSVLTQQANYRSEAIWNGQVKHNTKDLTNLDLKPMACGMYVLNSHALFKNVFYIWIALGLILYCNGNYLEQ